MQELDWKDFYKYSIEKRVPFHVLRESPKYLHLIMLDGHFQFKCRVSKQHSGYNIAKSEQSIEPFSIDVKDKSK